MRPYSILYSSNNAPYSDIISDNAALQYIIQ